MRRTSAKLRAPLSLRRRESSLRKAMSSTQWCPFSIFQCERIAASKRADVAQFEMLQETSGGDSGYCRWHDAVPA